PADAADGLAPWTGVAPTAMPLGGRVPPKAMDTDDIKTVLANWREAIRRTEDAGFEICEIHAAHGYLIHQFLSPLTNQRTDAYGGSFENRTRLAREVVMAVREVWPEKLPLFTRFSSTDWVEGGWDLEQSMELAQALKPLGVDVIDCSSGGIVPGANIPVGPEYQVPFAREIRKRGDMATAAVGMITEPKQAEDILQRGDADLIVMARQFLREPYWPLRAARELGTDLT
ncbi:MAG TPA: hypothetical protein VJ957_06065, partial [Longimicrobiales bacterium]|nr:hypothetical protein [Longimicrobiales bacterium]